MKNIATTILSAALISFILVLPLAILEVLNNTITKQNLPGLLVLFGLLWLLPTAFIVALLPVVRTARGGISVMASPVTLLIRLAFLAVIATLWAGILIDQFPCFLGYPNCD
jgi:hypothetical protein